MSIKIQTSSTYPLRIIGVVFPGLDQVERVPLPSPCSGALLDKAEGFSFQLHPPEPSFKVYKAMCDAGMKTMADSVLRNKKRSYVTSNHIFNNLIPFLKPSPPKFSDPVFDEVFETVRKEFHLEKKQRMLTLKNASKKIPQSTSPGLPWIKTHPGCKKGDILEKYSKRIDELWNRIGNGLPVGAFPDCAAFARSHISSPDVNKVRPVWAYPLSVVVAECRFGFNLIQRVIEQDVGVHTGYGMEMMKGGMHWLNNKINNSDNRKYLMVDFSGFDASVPAWLIRLAFSIIEENINFEEEVDESGNIFSCDPEQEKKKFKKIVNYFINTPVRLSDGTRIQTQKGIPSGSYFTNLLGTIVNMLVSRYLSCKVFGGLPEFDLYFGDDSFMIMKDHYCIDIEAYSKTALDLFGMIVNVKKTYHTTNKNNVKFLGYYNNQGSPLKPDEELIASMLFPQNLERDWAYCISRVLGCLLASAGNSHVIFSIVRAVVKKAERESGALERGLHNIIESSRSRRFLSNMGINYASLTLNYFYFQFLSMPLLDCNKLIKGV